MEKIKLISLTDCKEKNQKDILSAEITRAAYKCGVRLLLVFSFDIISVLLSKTTSVMFFCLSFLSLRAVETLCVGLIQPLSAEP